MRSNLVISLAVFTTLGCVATPHNDASEISSFEVSVYKAGLEKGCRDAGRNRGDSAAQVDSFCSCLVTTLNDRLSESDWKRATFFAQQRRDRDEYGVVAPHMPAVEQCRATSRMQHGA